MEDTRKAVVTGASGALGAAVAARFRQDGFEVIESADASLPAGFGEADVLALAHVVEDEPSWLECTPEEWREMRAAGLDTMFTNTQAYANARIASEAQGSVVIFATDASHRADGSDVLRSTLSWGVRGLVRNASTTYARKGVRVNGVVVDGDSLGDAAALAAFVAMGEHITGQTIPVAGGRALL